MVTCTKYKLRSRQKAVVNGSKRAFSGQRITNDSPSRSAIYVPFTLTTSTALENLLARGDLIVPRCRFINYSQFISNECQ